VLRSGALPTVTRKLSVMRLLGSHFNQVELGYIDTDATSNSSWQEYPITLTDYLAVRLWVAKDRATFV
jgi:hypothetical protein